MKFRCVIRGVWLERPIVRHGADLGVIRDAAKAELRKQPAGAYAEIYEHREELLERVDQEA